jgi:hypothetical protein
MLKAKRLIGVHNLLKPRTIGSQGQTLDSMDTTDCLERTDSMGFFSLSFEFRSTTKRGCLGGYAFQWLLLLLIGAPEYKDKAMVELPLELCDIKMQGFSCKLVNGVSLLPSFMHRLEARLLAAQLRCMLSQSYPAATRLSIDRMLEAITTANCQESFSLEGLEHLGDSFLKFAVSERLFLIHNQIDEGRLTKRRKAIICNPMLQKLCTERGLTVNLLFTVPSLLKF